MGDEANSSALDEIVDGCLAALDEELLALEADLVRRGLEQPLGVSGGRLVDSLQAGLSYEWSLNPGAHTVRSEDAVQIRCEAGEARGFVTHVDLAQGRLRISVTDWLGRNPGEAELTFDSSWLLTALSNRLKAVQLEPAEYHVQSGLRLFGRAFPTVGRRPAVRASVGALNIAQTEALERVLGSDAHLVWGPPGTGKTRLVGHLAAESAVEGRVLVLASTNVAVDEAAGRIADVLGEVAVAQNHLVRVGAEYSATCDPNLSLDAALLRAERDRPSSLTRTLNTLEDEFRPASRSRSGEALSLRARFARLSAAARERGAGPEVTNRLRAFAASYDRAVAGCLSAARVVVTTLARLALREELYTARFDTVVVDEVGSAILPYLFFAAVLAERRVVAVGDFQQLPPIVISHGELADRWLRRDVFVEAGVRDANGSAPSGAPRLPASNDGLCAMLTEQYRMRPEIRQLVSDLFYGGRLTDARPRPPGGGLGGGLILVDTSSLSPRVERDDGSRTNAIHLEVLLQVMEILARAGLQDVGVVTPYRTQTRRLRSQVRTRLGRTAPLDLEISTIHRFQGREKDVIVFDTVDAPPGRSWFLNELSNPDFPRLLNVALSRSRTQLLIVCSVQGLLKTLPTEALLNRLIRQVEQSGTRIDGAQVARLSNVLAG